jgi:hypothetical protein
MLRLLAVLIAAALLAPAGAHGATLTAAPSGSGTACTQTAPCSTVGAYNKAATGDTVSLAAGSYGVVKIPDGGGKKVTLKAAGAVKFKSLENYTDNVTYDGIDVDAQATNTVAFYNAGMANVTFKHGRIGNVVDEKGALADGDNMVFDDVVFHDVKLKTDGVHTECLFIMVPEGLVMRNSEFRNCDVMDVNMNWPGYWSPQPPAYGHVTIENNVFGRSNGAYGFVLGGIGPNPGAPACAQGNKASDYLRGWRVVNNTFENPVIIGDGDNGCGDGTNVWANNIGSGWGCLPGITYTGNVGQKCGAGDHAATVAGSWFADSALHLAAGSPAIGAASSTYAPTADRDGKARDSQPDAGAFEYQGGTVPPPLPADTDHDGIPDGSDACPTVAGAQPDGCPVPPPPPPADPCAQTVAERDQALADLAAMTDSRDAWKARAQKAEDQLSQIKTIVGG